MIQSPQSFLVSQECQKVTWQNGSRYVKYQTRNGLPDIPAPADLKGPDYPSETFRVLEGNEICQHGEYPTFRLVLAASGRMEANGGFEAIGM